MDCRIRYAMLCKDEENFYKQKSRVKWLKLGDKYTSYFFKRVNGHRAANKVTSIMNDQGDMINREENVHKEAVQYFRKFLGMHNGGHDLC